MALGRAPVVVLAGPRQCGKTTLARQFVDPESVNYFDLESPLSLARLEEPMTALAALRGLIVIDEVQLRPELFPNIALRKRIEEYEQELCGHMEEVAQLVERRVQLRLSAEAQLARVQTPTPGVTESEMLAESCSSSSSLKPRKVSL